MKKIRTNLHFYIIIVGLLAIITILLVSDFDISNEVTQAAIITLFISTIANILVTIINSYNNNKNQENNRATSLKLKELEKEERIETIRLEHELGINKEKELLNLKLKEQVENKSDIRKEIAINELSQIATDLEALKKQYFFDYKVTSVSYFTEKSTATIISEASKYNNETISLVNKYKRITKQGDEFFALCLRKQNELKQLKDAKNITSDTNSNKNYIVNVYYPIIKFISNNIISEIQKDIYDITRAYYCID